MNLKKYATKENLIVLSIMVFFSIVWFYLFLNFSTISAQDSFWYTRLAENLVNGKGFTLDGQTPHAQYPIGLPLLIIPFYIIFQNVFIGGIVLMFLLSLASIFLAYLIGNEVSKFAGICSALILASHNLFIFNSMSIMTETSFMFFSILGLYLFMKSYSKKELIIPAIISITFSILIRYDGFFIIFPMVFYMIYRRKEFEDFFFSRKTFIAIAIGIFILGSWFLRNLIAFGTPLLNAHSSGDGSTGLTINNILDFGKHFFFTGYLFPLIAILGILLILFNKKNLMIKTYLVWTVTYFLFHSWWWARGLRFYGQILILLCVFISILLDKLYKIRLKKVNYLGKVFAILILSILVLEQGFIFFSGSINQDTTIFSLNNYDPIKNVCDYANENLPVDGVYVVPEYVVYSSFLKKQQMTDYQTGLDYLFSTNKTIYFFLDNHHGWITNSFIPKNGKITLEVPTQQGINVLVVLQPSEIITFEKDSGNRIVNATIYQINGFNIIN